MKDTTNVLSHNVWSATEYSGDFTGFSQGGGINLYSSNNYSQVGEHSLKLTNKASSAYRLRVYIPASKDDTVTVSFDLLNQVSNFVALYNGGTSLVSTYPPVTGDWQSIVLSKKVTSTDDVFLQINCNAGQDCFVDNFKCVIS